MKSIQINPVFILFGVVVMLLLGGGLVYFAKPIWYFSMFVAPFLLVISAVINRRPLLDYAKMLGDTFWRNPLRGILYAAASFFGLPLVAMYLLFKAIFINKLSELQQQGFGDTSSVFNAETLFGGQHHSAQNSAKKDDDFADYEEIETTIK
jgi:hypothetical protein